MAPNIRQYIELAVGKDKQNLWPTRIWAFVLAGFLIYLLYYAWHRFWSLQGLPSDVPWAGAGFSVWSRGSTSVKSIRGLRELLEQGYHDYSKHGRPFIIPNIFTGPELILPPSEMRWLLAQPSQVLSQSEATRQFICAEYTMLHPKVFGEGRLATTVRKHLTRTLDRFSDDIMDEINQALEAKWGSDSLNWKEISLYSDMLEIIGRIVNRVLVGPNLCRDPVYLHHSSRFARLATVAAALISLSPRPLWPILAPIFTLVDKVHYYKMFQKIKPMVQERLLSLKSSSTLENKSEEQPSNFVQWALLDAIAQGDSEECSPEMITKRLAILTFAAIQSTTITMTNTMFDLASSRNTYSIQDELRAEAMATAKRNGTNSWTRETLATMTRTDSTLRESLRLWSFASHGVTKVVMAKEGITLPTGHHLPRGTHVGIASYGPQHDESVYPDPFTFEPFRHCQMKARHQSKALVSTSENFLAFSHGRYSCPGRFFASQQLKLLLAAIVSKYDIRAMEVRPENQWLNNTIGPDIFAKIGIRRRTNGNINLCDGN